METAQTYMKMKNVVSNKRFPLTTAIKLCLQLIINFEKFLTVPFHRRLMPVCINIFSLTTTTINALIQSLLVSNVHHCYNSTIKF